MGDECRRRFRAAGTEGTREDRGLSVSEIRMLDGTVQQISADAQDNAVATDGAAKPLPELAYRALIRLDADHLPVEDRRLKVVSGMAVAAEVHIGRRTVLEYLLSPIQKVAAEAARER
jgi:HlyD family secretion protein